jgi:hypothetical protein
MARVLKHSKPPQVLSWIILMDRSLMLIQQMHQKQPSCEGQDEVAGALMTKSAQQRSSHNLLQTSAT